MWSRRLLLFWLVLGCSPKRSAVNEASQPEDSAALLLVEIDRLSPGDRLGIYGCEPEKWPQRWDDAGELLQGLLELGEAELARVEQNRKISVEEFDACNWVNDPLACCRSSYLDAVRRIQDGGIPTVAAWAAHNEYLKSCRYAPRGYRSVRGCLNLVALSPMIGDYRDELNPTLEVRVPIPEGERLDVLRQTIHAVQHGSIDGP